ncbi:MAG TPA: methyltransferase domain-containing protein [Acidimicrobiia bacterium]
MGRGEASDGARYTFGDDERAVRRLQLLSDVLAASSVALLDAWTTPSPALAVDLGSGPGHSTALVATCSRAGRTVGLDQSARFVAEAATRYPTLEFLVHDVTTVPLPTKPPQLLYARLVLAHLVEPVAVVRRWANELPVGGRLLVEEMEWIDAPPGVLAEYETRVRAVVAAQGAPMAAGPLLADLDDAHDWHVVENVVDAVSVPVAVAAQIYGLNLEGWRRDPYAVERYLPGELDALADGLADLAARGEGELTWGLRHLVVTRGG